MRTIRLQGSMLLGMCVFCLVVGDLGAVCAQDPKPTPRGALAANTTDAEAAIRQTAQHFVEAFNKGDAKTVAALWTEDGEFVDETGDRTSGREAIGKKYAAFFSDKRDAKMEVAIDSIHQLGPDTAIEEGHSQLTLKTPAASVTRGRYTVVHVKRDGKWLMASVRDLPPAPSSENEQLEDLGWLIGSWHAEHLGVEMQIDCRWLAGKSFVEATYSKREGEKLSPTATQIIGVDPRNGRIGTWMFNSDKGYAHGVWIPHDTGWVIEFDGASADGTPTTAVNVLSRVKDALVWKSTQRSVAGRKVPDTEEVVLKRK